MNNELALIFYNIRCHNFSAVVDEATAKLKSRLSNKSSAKIAFWRICAIGFSGLHENAIRELEVLRAKFQFLEYAIISALIWFHRKSDLIDEANTRILDSSLKEAKSNANVDGILLAADFFFHISNYEAASTCLNLPSVLHLKQFQDNDDNRTKQQEACLERCRILFWVDLAKGRKRSFAESDVIRSQSETNINFQRNLDCLMIQVKHYEKSGEYNLSINILNEISLKTPSFYPAVIECAKIYFKNQHYALAQKMVKRALSVTKNNRDVIQMQTLLTLVINFNKQEQLSNLEKLLQLSSHIDLVSAKACFESAFLFSSICDDGNKDTLRVSLEFISLSCQVQPNNQSYHLEKAHILFRLKQLRESLKIYQFILNKNDDCIEALLGSILCQILIENKRYASDQLEFISVVSDIEDTIGKVQYQKSIIDLHFSLNEKEEVYIFHQLLEKFFTTKSANEFSWVNILHGNYHVGNVDEVTTLFLKKASKYNQGSDEYERWKSISTKLVSVINSVLKKFPYNSNLWVMLAKIYVQFKQLDQAADTIHQCMAIYPELVSSHLLKAQIYFQRGDSSRSQESLEFALSIDLEICHDPFYKFLKGLLLLHEGRIPEGKELLMSADEIYESCGMNETRSQILFTITDRLSCNLYLCKALKILDDSELFYDMCSRGEKRFQNSLESFQFFKMKIDYLLEHDEIEKASMVLEKVRQDSSHYYEAQLELANIHLKNKRDVLSFLQSYQNIGNCDKSKRMKMQISVGDAFKNASYYRHALDAYEIAVKDHAENDDVAVKLGMMFFTCQEFRKGSNYLEKNLLNYSDSVVFWHLIDFYVNTKQFLRLETLLKRYLNIDITNNVEAYNKNMLTNIASTVIRNSRGNEKETKLKFFDAMMESQTKKIEPITLSKSKASKKMIELLSFLCTQSFQTENVGDEDLKAISFLIKNFDKETNLLFAGLECAYKKGCHELCNSYCNKMRKVCPHHEGTIVVKGRLFMHNFEIDHALSLFENFLHLHPHSYLAMIEYLNLLKRMGRWCEIRDIGDKLEDILSQKATNLPHIYYMCMGVYHDIVGESGKALSYLNIARSDTRLSEEAIIKMVEIYMQLDDLNLWNAHRCDEGTMKLLMNSIKTLMSELHHCIDERIEILEGYQKLLTGVITQKSAQKSFKDAIDFFQSILHSKKEYIPALLGLASAFSLQGDQKKSKSLLKKIAKVTHQNKYWREFERCYLYLAQMYIDRDKLDLALELCKRCLFYNKACSKAKFLMGNVFLRQNKNALAIKCFHETFDHSRAFQQKIELAEVYLKIKKYLKVIDITTNELEAHSNYYVQASIILQKSISCLKI